MTPTTITLRTTAARLPPEKRTPDPAVSVRQGIPQRPRRPAGAYELGGTIAALLSTES